MSKFADYLFEKSQDAILKLAPLHDLEKPIELKIRIPFMYVDTKTALLPIEIKTGANELGWMYHDSGYLLAKSERVVLISIPTLRKYMEQQISIKGKKRLEPNMQDEEFCIRKTGEVIVSYISFESLEKLNEV